MMIEPVYFGKKPVVAPVDTQAITPGPKLQMNTNLFSDNTIKLELSNDSISTSAELKKPRRKKDTKTLSDGTQIILANDEEMISTNKPYAETYQETSNMLKVAIGQIDTITYEVKNDLDEIRQSKTLRKKYDYIPNLAGTLSQLMGTKINAIREMNSSITHSHDLELKRTKELKLNDKDSVTDEKHIMDMYNAFISMPYNNSVFNPPNMGDISSPLPSNMVRADIGMSDFNTYASNISSVQNSMRYENNPNVNTVVFYEPTSGRRWFDVIDKSTGLSIPNVDKPDQMFLDGITIDMNNMIARDTNLDITYDLIIINNPAVTKY